MSQTRFKLIGYDPYNTYSLDSGNNNIVRSPSGIPYVILMNTYNDQITVLKGDKSKYAYGWGYLRAQILMNLDHCTRVGQSFTPTATETLDHIDFLMYRQTTTGTLYARVYSHSGVYGTSSVPGTLLATSDGVSYSSIPSGESWVTFNFSGANRIQLESGTPYVVVVDYSYGRDAQFQYMYAKYDDTYLEHDGNLCIYTGSWTAYSDRDMIFRVNPDSSYAADATNFYPQDLSNAPQTSGYSAASGAMDTNGIIHIAYIYRNGKSSQLRYVQFDTSSDTFSGDTAVVSDLGGDVSIWTISCSIAVDSANKPHIAYNCMPSKGGSPGLAYANKVGASWRTEVEIEGVSTDVNCTPVTLSIDKDDKPCAVYAAGFPIHVAQGNANDAIAFTVTNLGGTFIGSAYYMLQLVVDSDGNHWVSMADNDGYIYYHMHNYEDSWSTWTSESAINSGSYHALVADGLKIYAFYVSSGVAMKVYDDGWGSQEVVVTHPGYNLYMKDAQWAYSVDYTSEGDNVDGSGGRTEFSFLVHDTYYGNNEVNYCWCTYIPVTEQDIYPTGIASGEAFGTPIVSQPQEIYPSGIPSAEAFGTPLLTMFVTPTGIESAEAFGTPNVIDAGSLSLVMVSWIELEIPEAAPVSEDIFGPPWQ
jgi:hypothetical protein